MGSTKDSTGSTTVVNQSQQSTMTDAEKQMQELELAQYKQTQPLQTQAQMSGLNLVNQLLTGQIPQGIYQQLAGGIDANAIGTQATQMMRADKTGLQNSGLLDSGVGDRAIAKDLANNLLYPTQQFNIGALQNLMNMALTGQAQVQAPVQAGTNTLANQLAGLRSTNTQGTTNQSGYTSSNPFLKSFYSSLGSTLGSPSFSMGPFGF